MWLIEPGFVDTVQGWWSRYSFFGSPSFILAKKLKALKEDLKRWNAIVFGDLNMCKRCILGDLLSLDVKEGEGGLSGANRVDRESLLNEYHRIAHLEETSWR
jgi:hypothetical protein